MTKIYEELTVKELYSLPETSVAYSLLTRFTYPWEALDSISDIIKEIGKTLPKEEYEIREGDIYISKKAEIAPTAFIGGPCIICEGAQVKHCAYIREKAIVGRGAVVGNSVELKSCILFDGVQVPHFNYVGDSILGYKAHMGAGAVTSNVKSDKTLVTVNCKGEKIETGRKKFGAMLGDNVEVGCNSVLNPGTVIGQGSNVYPLSSVRGYVPKNSIHKSKENIIKKF